VAIDQATTRRQVEPVENDDPSSPPPSPGPAGEPDAPAETAPAETAPAATAPDARAQKKRRRRKILVGSLLAIVLIAGIGMVAGTYYYDNVALPEDIRLEQATTIYYADGATPLARIGDTNRTVLTIDKIPVDVQHAVVAAQDETFYSNDGVNYRELAGTAWNHVFSDGRRGGSTISQQYARQWGELEGVSYSRKARESVMAKKLNQM
jgi:membrane peptidoglycan carboxypeptidase